MSDPDPNQKLGSVQYEESMEAELKQEQEQMDETDADNEEYFSDLMQRDD